MKLDEVFRLSEKATEEVSQLCSGLVKINSAHPDGYTDECVEFIKQYYDKHGIENEIHAKDPKKPNIVAKIKGKSDKTILWVGHLDVVPEGSLENWRYEPYSGKVADGMLWGRGSSDMKGACAGAMVAARLLNEMSEVSNNVEFWCTSDEEIGGGAGARWLAESGRFKADVCIIGDGNGGGYEFPSIDLGCKGGAGSKIIARGSTAHGSQPYIGDNAIRKLVDAIPWVEKVDDFPLDYPRELDPVIKGSVQFFNEAQGLSPEQSKMMEKNYRTPSVTCNIIQGGVKTNVIPDYAEADFDIRLTPGSTVSKVRDRIKELLVESGIDGVEVAPGRELSGISAKAGYYELPNSSFCNQLKDLLKEITGAEVNMKILQGGTDGISTSKRAGIPSIGYGTSLVGQAHQPDERISIENLVLGVKVYTAFPIIYK